MIGTIVYVYSEDEFEVEFVNEDGTNIEFEERITFTVDSSYFKKA